MGHMSDHWLLNFRRFMYGLGLVLNWLSFRLLSFLCRFGNSLLFGIFFRWSGFLCFFLLSLFSNFLFIKMQLLFHKLLEKLFWYLNILDTMGILSNMCMSDRRTNFKSRLSNWWLRDILDLRTIRGHLDQASSRLLIGGNTVWISYTVRISNITRLRSNELRLRNNYAA